MVEELELELELEVAEDPPLVEVVADATLFPDTLEGINERFDGVKKAT